MSRVVSASIDIVADAATVFDVIADPAQHSLFDGSGSVKGRVAGPPRLYLGATFAMRMRLGAPYLIRNRVVEYDEDRRIAWKHFGQHVWRYELTPSASGGTTVTESFDYAPAPMAWLYERVGFPERNRRGIVASLDNLKVLVEGRVGAA